MRKQMFIYVLTSIITSATVTFIFQNSRSIGPLWAQISTKAIVLSDSTSCPPGFSDITAAYNGRNLMARSDVTGTPITGGGDGSGTTSWVDNGPWKGSDINWGSTPWAGGPNPIHPHNHSTPAHTHSFVGFRLCQWTVN